MTSRDTILLTRKDITKLLDIGTCIAAVEMAFRLYAEGKTSPPKVLAMHVDAGAFHIKAGAMKLDQHYFAAKTNANLPDNPKKFDLPTIQGILIVFDADNGKVLAVMDSMELTILRTGAATGVAAKYLSKPDSSTVTICGCGNQGIISLKAIAHVRKIQSVYAFDVDHDLAVEFSSRLSKELGVNISAVKELEEATLQSDICVTCTPSKQPLLFKRHVRPGCFVAAVGTDNEEKNEIDAELIASSKLVTDISEQCATIGDLHHALKKGKVTMSHIHAELGEVIAGKKEGRTNNEEVIVFDSTGMALQDVASAAIVYQRSLEESVGLRLDFSN
ncbi:MAG TPA: ornithine cyclodeaminase family protein [Chryseolinea sp.]|nr:ornithine cyclodeaminase family protein [Chryseolinea sp.]